MVQYRRNRVAGGSYFFTLALNDRGSRWLVEEVACLRTALQTVKRERPFRLDAMVILPDHLHAVWTLPPGDEDYAARWQMIKARFSRGVRANGARIGRNDKGEYDLWQRRYWEHTIRDESDLRNHADYLHYNPVKHGWVSRVDQWPYSTFHRYLSAGIYPLGWSGEGIEHDECGYGE